MLSIILPTLNESKNVGLLIEEISDALRDREFVYEIIVIDANSKDGTADIVRDYKKKGFPVDVILTEKKGDLASDTYWGFQFANYDLIGVMDSDRQHNPIFLPSIIEKMLSDKDLDMVIGSRYVKGGDLGDWVWYRKIGSKMVSIIAKFMTDVSDPLTQFYVMKRSVIENVSVNPKGTKLSMELITHGNVNKIAEVPIVFRSRTEGEIAQSFKRVLTDIFAILKLFPRKVRRMFS